MEPFILEQSEDEPYLIADDKSGEIKFGGRILTYNEVLWERYYDPFVKWLKEFTRKNEGKALSVDIKLEYYNTSADKILVFPLIILFEKYCKEGKDITINWHYEQEDHDMLDQGKIYQKLTGIEFNYVSYEEDIEEE